MSERRALRLECAGLSGGRGELVAFRDIDLAIEDGTIHAVLGPNGAGKTTLLLTLAGLLPARAGTVTVGGVRLRNGRATAACREGVVLVPDNRQLFTTLSVGENLRVPARRGAADVEAMFELFPVLGERRRLRAGALSGGEQQMLAMARALIQRPKVLLVDELSMGLAPPVVEKLYTTIRQAVTDTGCSVVFVEQYVHVALEVADAVCVLNRGSIVLSGTASDVACQKAQLEDAYLGDQASGEPNGSDAAARLAAQ